MSSTRPRASVVIPAHDEAAVIGETLRVLLTDPGELEVVVVCNGCQDGTAQLARDAGARVVEIATASKIAALNAGDQAATVFPRIYLDADVGIDLASLRAVIDALAAGAAAAAPRPVLDTTGCGPGSRMFFRFRSHLGYLRHHTLGAGVYGLSEQGRARFGRFPEVIADDGFVYALFAPAERVNPAGATFTIRVPRTLRSTYHRQVRIALGNLQLARAGHLLDTPPPTWRQVVRADPRLSVAALVFVAVQGAARLRARRLLRTGAAPAWSRDETTRVAPLAAGVGR
ncbi:glycosyltransferase [Nocardioides sp.]|uniref:glycosyltransferase n=1 Tax=Nocardioides sp. TaxID=35761 RepID=UPI0039E6F4AF